MQEEKEALIKWFSELDRNSISVAGGKGANLAEIYNLKIQVPPGFVITAQAYSYFIEKNKLRDKIHALLEKIDYEKTEELDKITNEIRDLIVKKSSSDEIQKAAESEGMISMLQDGLDKVASGLTTIEEVMRVIRENR